MNILYICDTNPSCSNFGNEQRTHRLLKALQSFANVYVAHIGVGYWPVDDGIPVIRYQSQIGLKKLINAIWVRFCRHCLPNVKMSWLPFPLRDNLAEIFPAVQFDCVVKRYMYGLGETHLWRVAPLFVDVDDHLMEVFETLVLSRLGRFHALLSRLVQRIFLCFVERHISGGWITNEVQVSKVHFRSPVVVLKNLPNRPSIQYRSEDGYRDIVFTVGLMGYAPNYEGVDSFLECIWPVVHRRMPSLQYWIVGGSLPIEYANRWARVAGVRVCGFVENLEPIYQRALATIVPVNSGGGTCIKTLESLAYSRVCLSTRFGARGLKPEDVHAGANGIFCYESAQEVVSVLERLNSDEEFRRNCELAGFKFVEREFSEESFVRSVHSVVE